MRTYTTTVDPSVVCFICAGPHLPRFCTVEAIVALLELVPDTLPEYRPHGTLACALRERRAGGSAAMCPPCRDAWQRDQTKHRQRRRGRAGRH